MNFWDTIRGHETADAIVHISKRLRKKQQTFTCSNSEANKAIRDIIADGYTVEHIVSDETETLIIYK